MARRDLEALIGMQLGLSSLAAPDAGAAELLAACARRGLATLELVAGGSHGVGPDTSAAEVEALRRSADSVAVEIAAFRAADLAQALSPEAAALSAALGAPVIAPRGAIADAELDEAAQRYAAAGGTLLLSLGADVDEARALRTALDRPWREALGLAWEARPSSDDLADVRALLDAVGNRLRHVVLYGGGPEAAQQTGQGVGALMGRLALARYAGALVLAPSTPSYHRVWHAWLGRAGGWGCGSKVSDVSLVTL
jgi:hypothetical protein